MSAVSAMRDPRRSRSGSASGFTIVELMVSMAVLALLVILIGQLFSGATLTETGSRKRLDADGIARAVFGRMEEDFERMLKRPDVSYYFILNGAPGTLGNDGGSQGNDGMYFFAESTGYPAGPAGTSAGSSSISLVGYRINQKYQLERLGERLSWNTTDPNGMVYLNYAGGSLAATSTIAGNTALQAIITDATPTDQNFYYSVVGDGVFRMALSFQLKNGTYSNVPWYPQDAAAGQAVGMALQDVAAVVVTLAILDPVTARIVPTTAVAGSAGGGTAPNLSAAVTELAPFTPAVNSGTTQLLSTAWTNTWLKDMDDGDGGAGGLINAAAGQVRFYQRVFPLYTQ